MKINCQQIREYSYTYFFYKTKDKKNVANAIVPVNDVLKLWKWRTIETKRGDHSIERLNQVHLKYRSFQKYQKMNKKLSAFFDVSQENSFT